MELKEAFDAFTTDVDVLKAVTDAYWNKIAQKSSFFGPPFAATKDLWFELCKKTVSCVRVSEASGLRCAVTGVLCDKVVIVVFYVNNNLDEPGTCIRQLHPSIYEASVCMAYLVVLPVLLTNTDVDLDLTYKRARIARRKLYEFFFADISNKKRKRAIIHTSGSRKKQKIGDGSRK